MGRSGGGGGRSSGSSRSFSSSRSHGSSHSHSSSGRSSFSSGPGRAGRSGSSWSPRPPTGVHNHYYGGYGGYRRSYGYGRSFGVFRPVQSILSTIITAVALMMIFSVVMSMLRGSGGIPASTVARERVDTRNAYVNDCIVDEIGWIQNPSRLSRNLQEFYEKTGCQPFVYLKAYDSEMSSETAREAWTQEYYDTTFADRQNTLLYVYFCDRNDEGYGDSCLWMGTEASIVMDSEAVDIFWAYLDYDWDTWDTNDNDGMFADVFSKTASRIMVKTTTANDVKAKLLVIVGIVVVAAAAIVIIRMVFKRQKEAAEETAAILNAPLGRTSADDLADKYNDNE